MICLFARNWCLTLVLVNACIYLYTASDVKVTIAIVPCNISCQFCLKSSSNQNNSWYANYFLFESRMQDCNLQCIHAKHTITHLLPLTSTPSKQQQQAKQAKQNKQNKSNKKKTKCSKASQNKDRTGHAINMNKKMKQSKAKQSKTYQSWEHKQKRNNTTPQTRPP